MNKKWIELKAMGPKGSKDSVTFILVDSGSTGVLEQEDSEGNDYSLAAYIPYENREVIQSIKEALSEFGWICGEKVFEEYDWHGTWKKNLKTINIANYFTIKPTWKEKPTNAKKVVIEIDPGLAFGTGSHETTNLCLKALAHIIKEEGKKQIKEVLDVGTGTGILAIAAVKAGSKRAVGTDIDPVAIKVARQNAKVNKVKVEFTTKELSKVKGSYDVVFGNILSGELIRLRDDLIKKTNKKGFLILSGILATELKEVVDAFKETGLVQNYKTFKKNEWSCLILRKTA